MSIKIEKAEAFKPGIEWHRQDYCDAGSPVPFSDDLSIVNIASGKWYLHSQKTGERVYITTLEDVDVQ